VRRFKKVENVFHSEVVRKTVEKVSTRIGAPCQCVFLVKNYSNETDLDSSTSILTLLALRQVLYFSEDYMENLKANT